MTSDFVSVKVFILVMDRQNYAKDQFNLYKKIIMKT